MRVPFLALAFASLPFLSLAMTQNKDLPPPPAGLWHLLQKDEDEQNIPQHRVDIRLYPTPAPFRAAMVNRVTGADMPYHAAAFDGRTLRLQMPAASTGADGRPIKAEKPQAEMPWLQMTWDGTRFLGEYVDAAGKPMPRAIPLKLIRAR